MEEEEIRMQKLKDNEDNDKGGHKSGEDDFLIIRSFKIYDMNPFQAL